MCEPEAKALGALLNHSDKPLMLNELERYVVMNGVDGACARCGPPSPIVTRLVTVIKLQLARGRIKNEDYEHEDHHVRPY